MANSLQQEILQQLENGTLDELSPEDTFTFECTRECMGSCCQNIDIFLDPWDVETMARHLGITGQEFVKTYCILNTNGYLGWPGIKLKHVAEGSCAFLLEDGKCSIYPARSRNCRTAPIARAVRFQENHGRKECREKIFMISPVDSCQGFTSPKHWTVREWLKESGAYKYYELSDIYLELIDYTTKTLHSQKWLSGPVLQMIIPFLFAPDLIRSRLGITIEDMNHEEFYRRRMKALRVVLTEIAGGLGYGPQAGKKNNKGNTSIMEMVRDTLLNG